MPIAKQNKVLLKVEREIIDKTFKGRFTREKQWALTRWLISYKSLSFGREAIYTLQGQGKIWVVFAG
jgi:hypothetical protein